MKRPAKSRNILLLQGPSSPFFAKLGKALRVRGAEVFRVIFCPGDMLYWRAASGKALKFRGNAQEWPEYLKRVINQHEITDLICLGDMRWQHAEAVKLLQVSSVRLHIVEHGYLRPGWLTLEQNGFGANSPIPRDREEITAQAEGLEPIEPPIFSSSFLEYAALDIGYQLANLALGRISFPHYRRHALDHPLREWGGWIKRFARRSSVRHHIENTVATLNDSPYFLVPMQLETDFQIRLHGPDGGQIPLIERLIRNFAQNAPENCHLLFKMHPLDNGLTPWDATIRSAAVANAVQDRCHFVEGGDLDAMLDKAKGVLVVNSTVGLEAILKGKPVRISGDAIYRIEGLIQQDILEKFWVTPQKPDEVLADAFARLLMHRAMLPGAFDGSGASPGASAIAERILPSPVDGRGVR